MNLPNRAAFDISQLLAIQLLGGRSDYTGAVNNAGLYYVTALRDLLQAEGCQVPDEVLIICEDVAGYLVAPQINAAA